MNINNQMQSPQIAINSFKYLEVVKEEENEDERQQQRTYFNENYVERMLTAYTTPMKSVKKSNGNSSSSNRSPFQEINKSSSNQKVLTHVTPNKNSVLRFR